MSSRPPYESLPEPVRRWVERELGATVTVARTQDGGFSPGVAARLVTRRGGGVFVKAIRVSASETTATLHRREILAMQAIPPSTAIPRLLASYDADGWVALLSEDIEGRQPGDPWNADDARRVLNAVAELSAALTPSPWSDAPRLMDMRQLSMSWWTEVDGGADAWVRDHQQQLVALQEQALQSVDGSTLCHRDARADNILITDGGRVVFVDWAWACHGAVWIDTMQVVADLVRGGAESDPDELLAVHPMTRNVDPADLTAYLATLAGALYTNSRLPPLPNVPTLRPYQRVAADALLDWLRRRLANTQRGQS